jgi:L-alanine-DL-glutamate epimerase-like enolase superfamily enzyme
VLYDAVRDLSIEIDRLDTELLSVPISPEFTRKTTVVHLLGNGHTGLGEDVTYAGEEHEGDRFPKLFLEGEWTLASLSARLDSLELFPGGDPDQQAYGDYRRWAFESAALDLGLRQAGRSLADVLGREPRPVRFVSSTRAASLDPWLELYPELRFKLDPTPDWTDEFTAALAARGVVDVVDLKGQYHGTVVDQPPDGALYRRVAEAFPEAWIEDPNLTPETDEVLGPHRDRITWDAPIHSWADVEALPFAPRCLNVKPSRFGTLERLLEFYERCEERAIALYGGGQFELGVGRGQIQYLASLFSADGPNDVAPGGYNDSAPRPGLETSPLEPRPEPIGFRRSLP